MPKRTDTTRIQITLQSSLVERIDEICRQANVSRSVWIEYTLGTAANSMTEIYDRVAQVVVKEDTKE